MTGNWTADDEQLLAELGDAMRNSPGEVPKWFMDTGKGAYAWRTIDAELAELALDSHAMGTHTLAGARSEMAAPRTLTFESQSVTIELEITDDALRGQLVPPQSGEVVMRWDNNVVRYAVDDVGWFVIQPVPTSPFRLQVHSATGVNALTPPINL
jgi:hypothetical protein